VNRRRIEMLRRAPDCASPEEIVQLAYLALDAGTLREALFKVRDEADRLRPPPGPSRGGAIEQIHRLAVGALDVTRRVTESDMADTAQGAAG